MVNFNLFAKIAVFVCLSAGGSVTGNEFDEIGVYPQKRHSIKRPFTFEVGGANLVNNAKWELTGSALAFRDFIRLTEERPHQAGGLWNIHPIKFSNWEVQIDFNISGTGRVYGDGMAFFYVTQPLQKGPVFGNADYFTGLGIFLDTYPNKFHNYQYPYISAMFNNGTYSYNMDSDGKPSELTGCHVPIRNATHPTSISIQYQEGLLKVRTDVEQRNRWSLCFASRIHLPTGYYIGVTASTNYISDNHDVLEVRTYRIDGHPPTSRDDQSVVIVMPKGSSASTTISMLLTLFCTAFHYLLSR